MANETGELIKAITNIIATLGGVAGGFLALQQYVVAQKWKRSEFAAKELEKLEVDPDLYLACQMLDWSWRKFPLPPRYLGIRGDEEKFFTHHFETLVDAMKPETQKFDFRNEQVVYRDVFDRFFNYLGRIENMIQIGLISEGDVSSLEYWLCQISEPRFVPDEHRDVFLRFIQFYEYIGTQKLLERFGLWRNVVAEQHNIAPENIAA